MIGTPLRRNCSCCATSLDVKPIALQSVLIQDEMQRRHALAPIAVDRSHHAGWRCITASDLVGDVAQLVRVGPHDTESDRERRVRAEHQLGHAHPRFRRQAVGDASRSRILRLSRAFALGVKTTILANEGSGSSGAMAR